MGIKSEHGDVEWDDQGRLIIHDETVAKLIQGYVRSPRDGSRALFRVVGGPPKAPSETDPQDLLCRIVVDYPIPPKK